MPHRVVFPSKGEAALEECELPTLGSGDVKIKTDYSLISIGTETTILHQRYDSDTHFAKMFSYPQRKTGVQAIGTVEDCGRGVIDLSPGDRIFMRQAHGSHQVLPAQDCSIVPDGIDAKSGCWCGLAKTAFRAHWAAGFESAKNIVIVGAGPVGQMVVRWAKTSSVSNITCIDLSGYRLAHATRGGASRVLEGDIADHVDELQGHANGDNSPIIIDTTGNPAVFKSTLRAAPFFGKIILLGDTGFPSRQCLTSDVMSKGLTIQAVHDSHDRDGWTQRKVDEKFFDSVLDGRFDLSGLITHEFSPADCAEAYRLADENRESVMGILYDWTKMN